MPAKLQRPKGTQDITPADSFAWFYLQHQASQCLAQANYHRLETPLFEHTELFCRGVGEGTDIVSKEMYTFDKADRSLTLRPEGTAGLVRSFIEQGMHREAKPVKLYYFGPMFRYERPQEGRQRQFHQLGLELLGLETAHADAEAIALAWQVLHTVGVSAIRLDINTVGDASDRPRFREALQDLLHPQLPHLCEDCQRRFEQNPIRMLDCKVSTCQAIYTSPEVDHFLETFAWSAEATDHFQQLCDTLTALEIPFNVNRRLVRGLDYYTRTVFELITDQLGAQGTVCGGGRYNQLIESLGGPPTPAIGWGMGFERLFMLVKHRLPQPTLDAYIVTDQTATAMKLAQQLRQQGYCVEVDLSGKKFGKQLEQASKRGATYAIVVGDTEASTRQASIKHLGSGTQSVLCLNTPTLPA
ncbi:MAG: histidine--tRNA ligase [Vampirovibrionales bacterium]